LVDTRPEGALSAWAGLIDQVVVRSDMLTEAAFFHYPSRTLLLADLIENFERTDPLQILSPFAAPRRRRRP